MSKIHVTALLALSALAFVSSTASAQRRERQRDREAEPVRIEQELKFQLEVPAMPSTQCDAVATSQYEQRNTIARLISSFAIADCTAASGTFTVTVRVRDDSGETKEPLEFSETYQRSDDQDVKFTKDYTIGENVELVSVRVRNLRCTCADAPAQPSPSASTPPVASR